MTDNSYDSPRTHYKGARHNAVKFKGYSIRHPYLIAALLFLVGSLFSAELALHWLDPWQADAYFTDLAAVLSHMQADTDRGYVNAPGVYVYSSWTVHINRYGQRLVPATHPAGCRIALLGDSVTFGYGVSDDQTWANQLALDFPGVQIINTGVNGYNTEQVAAAHQLTPAEGYLYLLINNDADPPLHWQPSEDTPVPYQFGDAFRTYWYVWDTRHQGQVYTQPDYSRFTPALIRLKQSLNVQIIGFDHDPLADRAGVTTIPYWTHANSYTDGHANAAGNQQIAAELHPYIAQMVKGDCHAGY